MCGDFGGIVAKKKQQYRQNHVVLIFLPRACTRGYDIFTFSDTKEIFNAGRKSIVYFEGCSPSNNSKNSNLIAL